MNKELRQQLFEEANYMCQCGTNCGLRATESHHVVEQRKYNIKKYGIERIESRENIVVVSRKCHNNHNQWDKQKKKELIEKWDFEILNNLF